ncbi:MAG: serine hydrolase, partial [Oscillospiraceae bacterium]|nr:serine hydrolase [Oscillospiraceae bacterium]
MKKTARILSALLAVILLLQFTALADGIKAPELNAKAAVVMDYDTGEILFSKNGDTPRAIASMTKLITAYIVLEEIEAGRLSFDKLLTVSEYASSVALDRSYTNIPLNQGERVSVDILMKGMLLPSGCGASVVLAEAVSGSEEAFCQRMNETAAKMGIEADFTDCFGMEPNMLSAHDMAIFARNLISRFPVILEYTSLPGFTFKGKLYSNTNGLLSTDGVDGLKTGTTNAAGYCLTATAVRGGRRLITVVMGCAKYYRVPDSQKLMNYGFSLSSHMDPLSTFNIVLDTPAVIKAGYGSECRITLLGVSQPYDAEICLELDGKPVSHLFTKLQPAELDMVFPVSFDMGSGEPVEISAYLKIGDDVIASDSSEVKVITMDVDSPTDFDDHWAGEQLRRAWKLGMIYPDSDGILLPDSKVTRAEFVTYIRDMLPEETVGDYAEHPFIDAVGHWAEDSIIKACETGIMIG